MTNDADTTAAYMAGLIDGEGYIGIRCTMPTKANRVRAPKYAARVSIAMTDREPVELVAAECGVGVKARTRGTYKMIYIMDVQNERAAALLRRVLPYLVCKKARALIVIELDELRRKSATHRTKIVGGGTFTRGRNTGGSYRVFGLSDAYVAACHSLYERALVNGTRHADKARARALGARP